MALLGFERMGHTQNGGLVEPAPPPRTVVVGSRCWRLLPGAFAADFVFNLLGVLRRHLVAGVSFVAISYPLLVEEGFGDGRRFVCDIFWGLEMVVAAGRAESLLSSVLNSQISLQQS